MGHKKLKKKMVTQRIGRAILGRRDIAGGKEAEGV